MLRARFNGFATGVLVLAAVAAGPVRADTAVGLDAGSLGVGASLSFSLAHTLVARLGYSQFGLARSVTDTNATYDGRLKLDNGYGMLDWHPGGHGFKLSMGAVATGNKIDIVGVANAGTFQLGSDTYTAADVGSVQGSIRIGSGVAPYVGMGFGNAVGSGGHLRVLFDMGVVMTGSPKVSLTATCSGALPADICAQVQQSAQQEISDLQAKVSSLSMWPVVSVGFAWRL